MGVMMTLQGAKELNKRLDKLANLKIKFRNKPFISEQERVFNTKGGSIGKQWQQRKGRANYPILDKTGRLKRSLKAVNKPNELTITRDVPYFKYHQLGTRTIPARPTIGISDRMKREANKQVKEAVNKI